MEGLSLWLKTRPGGQRICRAQNYSLKDESIQVTEVHRDEIDGTNQIITKRLNNRQLIDWSNDISGPHDLSSGRNLTTRLVWLPMEKKTDQLLIQQSTLEAVKHNFRIEAISIQGFTVSPGDTSSSNSDESKIEPTSYSIGFPDLPFGAAWSTSNDRTITQGIIWAIPSCIHDYQDILNHQIKIADHPMIVPLIISIDLTAYISDTMEETQSTIRNIEFQTGHHDWKYLPATLPQGNLGTISPTIGGCRTKMAYMRRRNRIQSEMLALIRRDIIPVKEQSDCGMHEKDASIGKVISALEIMRTRHETQVEYLLERCHNQQTVVNQQIAQHDASLSYRAAQSSHELAVASKRDSSAMKSLTIVAGLFLPGTFVASFFAMPFFHLEDGHVTTSSDIWMYCAAAIPLTVIVLVVWYSWSLWRSNGEGFRTATPAGDIESDAVSADENLGKLYNAP